jgi:hypothetical protein
MLKFSLTYFENTKKAVYKLAWGNKVFREIPVSLDWFVICFSDGTMLDWLPHTAADHDGPILSRFGRSLQKCEVTDKGLKLEFWETVNIFVNNGMTEHDPQGQLISYR